jgi:hypothetical protein
MFRLGGSGRTATRRKNYSLDDAVDFLVSATVWDLHKESGVDRDATRLRGRAREVRPLVARSVISQLAHCHAIARIATIVADHPGHIQR